MAVNIPPETLDELERTREGAMKELEEFEKSVIRLKLDSIKDADVITDSRYIVHVAEYARIRELITDSLREARNYDGRQPEDSSLRAGRNHCQDKQNECHHEQKFKRNHDTIMLAGVRGSGKTTFMLSILDHIRNGHLDISLEGKSHAECEIEVLPIFDPTLIEDKTHIFVNIIAMIKAKVDEKAKKANCFNDDSSYAFTQYQQWEKSFRELAEGLPTIDGLGGNHFDSDLWMDHEYVMKKGVTLANAAINLERAFHEFVRQSLRFLCKDAFILCFDDVDTNFSKGWPVLEVLHKYLTTPQMITVLSGDTSLYSTLIRERQWRNFSDKLLQQECRNKDERANFKSVVAHLEEQYFLKLLKPQRRIFLNNLYQLNIFGSVRVLYSGNKYGEYLQPMYDCLLTRLGTGRSDKADSYRFLASLPLRSQKQLLLAYIQQEKPSKATRRFIQDIFDIFWSDLTVKNINVSSLRNNPETIAIHTLNYLVANDLLTEGYTLNQNDNDPLTNGAQFALGAVLHEQSINDPAQIFEYWVRVCMAREIGVLIGDRQVSKGEGPSIRNFIDHCALSHSKSPRYLARFSTAYLRAFRAYNYNTRTMIPRRFDEKAWHGTLPLYGLSEKAKGSRAERETRIDYVLFHPEAKTHPLLRIIGAIPLSGATDHSKRALPIYSIYNILGILGDIITTAHRYGSEFDTAAQEVAALLYRDAQFREYPLPNWASTYGTEDEVEAIELPSNPEQFDHLVITFAEQMVLWSHLLDAQTVTASLLGKVFTRLFYTLNNLDTQYHSPLLGKWLHRMVVIFLHSAFIVEAMDHHKDLAGSQLQLTNPVTTDKILLDNLTRLNNEHFGDDGDLPFSRWLLACPLWELYLDTDTEGRDLTLKIHSYIKPYVHQQFANKIFSSFKKTESDYFRDIFDEYNLVRLLNEQMILVKGNEEKKDQQQTTILEERVAKKIPFTFLYKNRLVAFFKAEGLTKEQVKDMTDDAIMLLLNRSHLSLKFTFQSNIAARIKRRIGVTLAW